MKSIIEPYFIKYKQEVCLLDRSMAIIRAINPRDRNALCRFHSRLSEDTRFLRYQYLKGDLTENDLSNFCDIDYVNCMALVAERTGQDIIGVGRYCRLSDPIFAEVAIVVQDTEQRKGIGTLILNHLAALAWKQNIVYFIAEILRNNGRILSILRKADPSMKYIIGDGSTCTITFSIKSVIDLSRVV